MGKKILGLDLGTNSIGWALLEEKNNKPRKIIDLGSRIFTKAVEEKTPTPKNVKRRDKRLARRVNQRRARRKQRMLNYLVKLDLLPKELQDNTQLEKILNDLGNPYELRAKALDKKLTKHELGRVFLHLVQRRGFLSSRKTLIGDMVDDPDVKAALAELEEAENNTTDRAKEETAFKKDINELRGKIKEKNCRTLGEYLSTFDHHECRRNRNREGGHLRTDRQMYREELDLIWKKQQKHHQLLTNQVREQIEEIIFYQRPLKLRADRIGKCSLEPQRNRAMIARLESQRFRYLQDINNLQYFDYYTDKWIQLGQDNKRKLIDLFETKPSPTFKTDIRKALKLDKGTEFNLEQGNKKPKGNITACTIRDKLPDWDQFSPDKQKDLVEDLLTIRKKSVLKNRLMNHWGFDPKLAVDLCLLEFEPGHSNLSTKAINKLLPHLQEGQIYSDACINAGYGYEQQEIIPVDRLGMPPEIPNPIVQKGLHELRRLINAIIAEYGKPDAIRIEMARELEMNTKRYNEFRKQQDANTKANDEALEKYKEMGKKNPHLQLSSYPSRNDKIKYRLWKDQEKRCAYSGKTINLSTLFSAEIDVDHILPYSKSLDDSYMNKVVCFAGENRYKGQRSPIDAFGGNTEKWEQITQRISHWDKKLKSKKNRFYMTEDELQNRDFISSQLNDTRYISRVAQNYLKQLGADISVSKGATTAWLRRQWDLNSLISTTQEKERKDHRHHAIDAVVIACVDRQFYKTLIDIAKDIEESGSELKMRDLHIDPVWNNLRLDLEKALDDIIIALTPQHKLSDALHEESGSGFIKGKGTVYRKELNTYFDGCKNKEKAEKQLKGIVDPEIRKIIKAHLGKYDYNAASAFAEGITVFHKDSKTPIKRIRVFQSQVIKKQEQLEREKFPVKNKQGEIFKWYAYGNVHHIEVIKEKETNKHSGLFVTMMEAHRRAMTGTKSAAKRKVMREPIIKTDHGSDHAFIMALHKQDTVSLKINSKRVFYQIETLGQLSQGNQPRLKLVPLNNADGKSGAISDSITNLIEKYGIKLHKVNAIGKLIE